MWEHPDDETYHLAEDANNVAVVVKVFKPRTDGDRRVSYTTYWSGTAVLDGHPHRAGLHETPQAAMTACEDLLKEVNL